MFERDGLAAACITVIPTTDLAAVAALWGADLTSPVPDPYDPPPFGDAHSWHVWFDVRADRIVVVEDNGYRGNEAEVIAAASRLAEGGRVASAFWNVNAMACCTCAEAGSVLIGPEEVRYGDQAPPEAAELDDFLAPFRSLPDADELDDSSDLDTGPSWIGTALAMVERWTSTPLMLDLLDVKGRTAYLLEDRLV
ncbi:hypothetical protein RDV89_04025 [Nocardioides zeae]|uniref:Uncharacterized protein n=1 Tax=Nocardioides imazamoxiresistens TaxID=3231893 RepID=A0ABU3PSP5_9ACTN|nr:hypothetical protein [Nocardioides zeae]MDT9592219.1 hypothetical protein [Nocardioides zeae]